MQLSIYDTLQRRVVPLTPQRTGEVRMYTCGPTVYRPVHLGNLRSYLLADWLRRTLEHFGNTVVAVKNITDVGHMRQDAVERGEDKVIAAALAEGKTPKEIAEFYETRFHEDERRLGILPATHFPRATDHVPEMISIIERLIARGLAYQVEGAVYFAVKRFSGYGRLSGNVGEALRQGVRGDLDPKKRDPADFALWKKAEAGRALTWDSPWGPGFPGWHIECSAMSTKYLGERFDLHTGGVDNIFPHHEDEIAQSEGAYGHASVGHWVHGQHLLADGVKMAKSARNTVTIDEMVELGIDPLAFRYQCLLTHYRTRMQFSLGALRQAAEALDHLRQRVRHWSQVPQGDPTHTALDQRWIDPFARALADDLNLPAAVAWLQSCAVDRAISDTERLAVFLEADKVLGLDLASVAAEHAKASRIRPPIAPSYPAATVASRRASGGRSRRQKSCPIAGASLPRARGPSASSRASTRAISRAVSPAYSPRCRRTAKSSSSTQVPEMRRSTASPTSPRVMVASRPTSPIAISARAPLGTRSSASRVAGWSSCWIAQSRSRAISFPPWPRSSPMRPSVLRDRGPSAPPTSSTSMRSRAARLRRCKGIAPRRDAMSFSKSAALTSGTASIGISTSRYRSPRGSGGTASSRSGRTAHGGTNTASGSRSPRRSASNGAAATSIACTGGFTASPSWSAGAGVDARAVDPRRIG
ncbi:MAG: cysteine--tRNA ligase [Chloroflexi bacterium]|nr:MAG: cysteine--tRNA ligase [Chloroflexota bacterium]